MTLEQLPPPAWAAWLSALREPEQALRWPLADWERVVRLARRLRLLARLGEALEVRGVLEEVPIQPRRHLLSEMRLSRWQMRAMGWALERVATALVDLGQPLVLLKGGAYFAQQLPIAAGRLPSDVDILLPHAALAEAMARLDAAGWRTLELDEHDRRYYFEWSHEAPPMRHPIHPIELDLHHNILPPRDGRMPDADRLFESIRPSRLPLWQVLSPPDQVLHSAAHLFFDAEPKDRVRDLVDLDGLLRHFGPTPMFWDELPRRAEALGLLEPLALACRLTRDWLDTPIPSSVSNLIAAQAGSPMRLELLVRLMSTVLTPTDPDHLDPPGKRLAATAVLARYHWHRMPLRALIPHLWRKSRSRGQSPIAQEDIPVQPQ